MPLHRVRFDRFVDHALYHPETGFYSATRGAGRRADFLTSVEVGPLFGAVLANALDSWWEELGRPDPFTVVDAGAGPGTLGRTVAKAAPRSWAATRWIGVDRSAAQRDQHTVGASTDQLPERLGTGVVIANELLDNLPFRLLVDGTDVEVEDGRPVPPLPDIGVEPRQDEAAAWVERATAALGAGRVVVLDYADTTRGLRARPWRTWLRTYRAHERGDDPWIEPGAQDITCEVAVDQLPEPSATSTQAGFLAAHGIDDLVEAGRATWAERAGVGDLAALLARSRVREAEALTDPAGLGAFTVLEWAVG